MTLDGPIVPLVVIVASVSLFLLRTRLVPHNTPVLVATIVATVVIALWLELQMGRTPVYRHGPVRLWSGDITSDQNSQQIFDPYSFTHIVHGPIFYGLTRLIAPAATPGTVATAVISLEAAWEAYENTDQVINRYRSETVSLGYVGDSVINSLFDIVCCAIGMLLAWRWPAWVTVAWVVGVEFVLALWIRDNLALNILMLVYPIDAIKVWQSGL